MITIHIYSTEDGDQFKVYTADGEANLDNLADVTDQYEVAAAETETGRVGFLVTKLQPETIGEQGERHETGAEL